MSPEDSEKLGRVAPISGREVVHESYRTVVVFAVLITVWAALRLYARHVRYTPLNVEDTLFYIAVLAFYAMVAAFFVLLYLGGVGYHMVQLRNQNIARLTQTILAVQALYGLAMCASKWSILWMLKRIFIVRTFHVFVWIIIVFQAAWLVMTVLIGFLICSPIQKNWDPTVKGTCGHQIAGFTAVSVVNVIIDIAMCLLPLPMIWGLQVKKPYKAALFGIFSIGVVSVIFAVLRLLSLRKLDFEDFSYTVPSVITWTYAETGVIILVACSPLLRPVFDKLFRRVLSTRSQRNAPSQEASDYILNSKAVSYSKSRAKAREGFVTVGDSEESLELGNMSGRTCSKANVSGGSRVESESSAGVTHIGIFVKKEVSQTVDVMRQ